MSQYMRSNLSTGHGRNLGRATLDKPIDSKTSEAFPIPTEEYGIIRRATVHQLCQHTFGF